MATPGPPATPASAPSALETQPWAFSPEMVAFTTKLVQLTNEMGHLIPMTRAMSTVLAQRRSEFTAKNRDSVLAAADATIEAVLRRLVGPFFTLLYFFLLLTLLSASFHGFRRLQERRELALPYPSYILRFA